MLPDPPTTTLWFIFLIYKAYSVVNTYLKMCLKY